MLKRNTRGCTTVARLAEGRPRAESVRAAPRERAGAAVEVDFENRRSKVTTHNTTITRTVFDL